MPDLHEPLLTNPAYLYGMLLAQQRMILSIGLMHATKPELREELLPALQSLRDTLVGEAISETVLLGLDAEQEAVDRIASADPL